MQEIDYLRRTFTTTLLQTGRQWRRMTDQALMSSNISEACAAPLLWIGRLGGGVRQITLASHIGIEGPSLVRLIDQLEAADLVVRKEDKSDRRAKTLWLTRKGKQYAGRLEDMLVGLRAQILADVSKEDLSAALRVLAAFDNARTVHAGEPLKREVELTP
ncbi:MAG: MarR family transcriptional regulator [Phyllobacterium sp.]|uniref:MarR family winged helix-turn-helix transcriptional regulator n=1 Tax=Phyllobacterium sp. TaxID=1871046 RepID=UPI0030F2ECF5